jgi:DNA invertase Pin-like site-specific DNA recombinase
LIFSDDGYSGSTLVRPALERLRDAAAAGAVDRLYVHSPDRLARDFALQILLIDEWHRAGLEIVFLNHDADDSPEGKLLVQIQGVIAQYERAKILERSRRGRQHAARSGAISALTGAPYGYHYLTKTEGDGKADYRVVLERRPASFVRSSNGSAGNDARCARSSGGSSSRGFRLAPARRSGNRPRWWESSKIRPTKGWPPWARPAMSNLGLD